MYHELTLVSNPREGVGGPCSFSAVGRVIVVIVIGVCALLSGCENAPTIWKAEAQSPDRLWLASVRTQQHGGFGSAGIINSVYLKRINSSTPPIEILEIFSNGAGAAHPYVLDNANAGGTINLAIKWVNPSRLDVTYRGPAEVSYQVAQYGGIEISVRDLSVAVGPPLSAPR
jgi:hypothetical protein